MRTTIKLVLAVLGSSVAFVSLFSQTGNFATDFQSVASAAQLSAPLLPADAGEPFQEVTVPQSGSSRSPFLILA